MLLPRFPDLRQYISDDLLFENLTSHCTIGVEDCELLHKFNPNIGLELDHLWVKVNETAFVPKVGSLHQTPQPQSDAALGPYAAIVFLMSAMTIVFATILFT